MITKERYEKAMAFAMKKRYFYLPDYNRYAMKEGGSYHWINKGKVELHQSYMDITLGDIYAKEIAEEGFYEALEKSKNEEEGYEDHRVAMDRFGLDLNKVVLCLDER